MIKAVGLIAVFTLMFSINICSVADTGKTKEADKNSSRRFNEAVTPPVYHPSNYNVGTSSTTTATQDRVNSSPKYKVPNINRKGSYGQAK
ncbi:MAG: hypothetical protein C0392_05860 [Syntrophus sp. (in: bacteria)]|nr:hypothetical protein [Syntrophus sp. (in: bacteria)]